MAFPDLLSDIRRSYRGLARRKGIDFTIAIDADVPPAIVTDQSQLQALLDSLLAKAFEAVVEGSVTLRICRDDGPNPAATLIVFQVLAAITTDRDLSDWPCVGASLALAQAASAVGGKLSAVGTPGGGIVFRLSLPLVPAGTKGA